MTDLSLMADPFADQRELLWLVEDSARVAGVRAARENDERNLYTPVDSGGRLVYVLNFGLPGLEEEKRPQQALRSCAGSRWMWMVVGPEGAGKSTFIEEFVNRLALSDFVTLDADKKTLEILPDYEGEDFSKVKKIAAILTDEDILRCIRNNQSFLFETNGSAHYVKAVREARQRGFKVGFVYFSLSLPELSAARAALRVQKGGHHVDPVEAADGWRWSHENAKTFMRLADTVVTFDNSGLDRIPIMVAAKLAGWDLLVRNPGANRPLWEAVSVLKRKTSQPTVSVT